MSNIAQIPIEKSVAKAVLGLVAAAVLATPVSAQFVTTEVSTKLFEPSAVATDSSGNVYITDSSQNCILMYVPSSGSLTTLAGTSGTQTSGTNNGIGAAAQFSQPRGMVAARGGLVVVDQVNQTIRYVSFFGAVSNLAGVAGVTGNQNGPALSATFSFPNGIAADSLGNLYVADEGNNAIRRIDTNNNVSTVAVGGYSFATPTAVAVDDNNNLWVADTGHHVICLVSNNVATVVAGVSGTPGANDSPIATTAHFSLPGGVLWDSLNQSLLISDTGNDTVRRLFVTNFNGSTTYSVQTLAGLADDPGFVNGSPDTAQFSGPTGLAVDAADFGFFIVDTGNNAVRVFQPSAPQPPVPAPQLGYVTFVPNGVGGLESVFHATTAAVFNNTAILAVSAQTGTETYMTSGQTPSDPLHNTIQLPGPNSGSTPLIYPGDGSPPPIPSILSQIPDLTVYVIGEAPQRQSSPVVSARFQFVTASPNIIGDNSAAITLIDQTTNAEMWYTLDGSAPMPNGTNSRGPVTSGQVLSIPITVDTTFSVQAFANNFSPSGIATKVFSPTNFNADKLTFGFQSGEASSKFIGAAGQRFVAPVTLSLIPSAETMYSLQFDLVVTNLTGPPVGPAFTFQSMLEIQLSPDFYIPIPPGIPLGTNGTIQSGLLTNNNLGLLEVGWVERPPFGNLYPSKLQTLISFSQAHDTVFKSGGGEVIVGAFSFVIPPTATPGQTYQINTGNGSATSDGINTSVFIQTVTNGASGQGAINSTKIVTVGSAQYLVGDAAPFRWFNAGDFGDTNLQSDDVTEVFQSAVYGLNFPPTGSDYFDAMDSSDGTDNNLYNGNDATINAIKYGDGVLAVDDVYVTFRRSLDYSLTWYDRYWSNGVRQVVAVPNTLEKLSLKPTPPPVKTALTAPRYITVAADQVQSGGSLNVQVPVRVLAADAMPIRVMMLGVEIDPLDGSPPITETVSFSPAPGLNTSNFLTSSLAPNMYGGAWLDSTVAGVTGTGVVGTLNITLPSNVTASSAYKIHFDHFSASPNGLALFHSTVQDGLITVGDRTGSSWNDGIPDNWRLVYFGTVSDPLSAADADPDGDGASNWQEFIAGTNPKDSTSVFQFLPVAAPGGAGFVLQWPSVVNKHYTLQSASSINAGTWTTLTTNVAGTGQPMQWTDSDAAASAKFYRALVQ